MSPTPAQVLVATLVLFAIEVALMRMSVAGPAVFNLQNWLAGWWTQGIFVFLIWWALPGADGHAGPQTLTRPASVAACFVLWMWCSMPAAAISQFIFGAIAQGWVRPGVLGSAPAYWVFYVGFLAWMTIAAFVLVARVAGVNRRTVATMAVMLAATGLTVWQFHDQTWEKDYSRDASTDDKPRFRVSQQTLEDQQALWQRTVAALAPEREKTSDVYALVFAPYASEDVFLRESTMVSGVLQSRFDAAGRTLHLVNHVSTTLTHPWATPLNLQRGIEALAQRMDRDNDVLVVYMTSHGASNFRLAAYHWPLDVPALTPGELRLALDRSGIKNRVIAISACYAGGWIDALANDDTLVMTAADATHTSYGCGSLSEFTFFGRAMFDEQLRSTHSFEKAFAQAVPVIKQREIDAGKDDGFSNPQIRMGASIAPVLRSLEQRLETGLATAMPVNPAPPVSAASKAHR